MEVQIGSGGWSSAMRIVGVTGAPGSTGATGSQGIQGPAGSQGTQGIQGPAGANGATTYTWIKYGTSSTGAGLQDSPVGMTYMGIAYNKLTATESTTATDYTWSLIQGAAGSTGSQGIQGPAGSNGAPTYTWIKYGTSAAGAGITDSPTGMSYMGIAYNKLTQTESVTPSDYTWSLIQGAAGAQGSQGSQGIQGIQGPQGPAGGLQTQVFFVAPTTPWNVGDMYWDGTGIMRRCIQTRGGSYTYAQYPGDWSLYSIRADYVSASVALSSPSISGGTISAALFRTAASGERLEMSNSVPVGYIYYYPPSGSPGGVWFSQGTLDEAVLQTSAISGKVAAVLDLRSAATIGTATVNADLTVNGAISQVGTRGCTLGGALGVAGVLTPSGGIAGHTVSGTLTVTGSATVSGTLGVTGVLTAAGGCDMSASASNALIFKSSNGNIVKFNVNATGHLQRSIDGGAWALVGSTG